MSVGVAYHAGMLFLAGGVPEQRQPRIVRWQQRYYRWTGAFYSPMTDEEVNSAVTKWLVRTPAARSDANGTMAAVTNSLLRDVMLAVRTESELSAEVQPGTWIGGAPTGTVGPFLATAGGIIDLGRAGDPDAQPLPSGHDFFSLSALPVAPDLSAPHPVWDQFLAETFRGYPEGLAHLQEAFGYCLWPDCRYELFFILYGDGNSGKGTAVETLQNVLGSFNVSATSLDRLGGRFDLADLIGKLANIVFDASDIDRVAEGTFKALVSGEPVPVEQKYAPSQTLRLTAKHFVVANVLPRFHDTTNGIWRRMNLLPFDNVCPRGKRDPSLKERLRAELPGIAAWVLQGLARVRANNGFTVPERANRLVARYRMESNPVALLLSDRCEAGSTARVGRQVLYATYRTWAEANGFSPLSVTKFNREVHAIHPQPDDPPRDVRGGDRVFVGIRLRDDPNILAQFRNLSENPKIGG